MNERNVLYGWIHEGSAYEIRENDGKKSFWRKTPYTMDAAPWVEFECPPEFAQVIGMLLVDTDLWQAAFVVKPESYEIEGRAVHPYAIGSIVTSGHRVSASLEWWFDEGHYGENGSWVYGRTFPANEDQLRVRERYRLPVFRAKAPE